jgi:hypothetical protein
MALAFHGGGNGGIVGIDDVARTGYPRKAVHSVTSGLQAPEAETARDGPPGHSE